MSKNSTIELVFCFTGVVLFHFSISKVGSGLGMLFVPIALASLWLVWEAGSECAVQILNDFLDKE